MSLFCRHFGDLSECVGSLKSISYLKHIGFESWILRFLSLETAFEEKKNTYTVYLILWGVRLGESPLFLLAVKQGLPVHVWTRRVSNNGLMTSRRVTGWVANQLPSSTEGHGVVFGKGTLVVRKGSLEEVDSVSAWSSEISTNLVELTQYFFPYGYWTFSC